MGHSRKWSNGSDWPHGDEGATQISFAGSGLFAKCFLQDPDKSRN